MCTLAELFCQKDGVEQSSTQNASQKLSDIYMETNILQGRMQKQGIWILASESWRNTRFWLINILYH